MFFEKAFERAESLFRKNPEHLFIVGSLAFLGFAGLLLYFR